MRIFLFLSIFFVYLFGLPHYFLYFDSEHYPKAKIDWYYDFKDKQTNEYLLYVKFSDEDLIRFYYLDRLVDTVCNSTAWDGDYIGTSPVGIVSEDNYEYLLNQYLVDRYENEASDGYENTRVEIIILTAIHEFTKGTCYRDFHDDFFGLKYWYEGKKYYLRSSIPDCKDGEEFSLFEEKCIKIDSLKDCAKVLDLKKRFSCACEKADFGSFNYVINSDKRDNYGITAIINSNNPECLEDNKYCSNDKKIYDFNDDVSCVVECSKSSFRLTNKNSLLCYLDKQLQNIDTTTDNNNTTTNNSNTTTNSDNTTNNNNNIDNNNTTTGNSVNSGSGVAGGDTNNNLDNNGISDNNTTTTTGNNNGDNDDNGGDSNLLNNIKNSFSKEEGFFNQIKEQFSNSKAEVDKLLNIAKDKKLSLIDKSHTNIVTSCPVSFKLDFSFKVFDFSFDICKFLKVVYPLFYTIFYLFFLYIFSYFCFKIILRII